MFGSSKQGHPLDTTSQTPAECGFLSLPVELHLAISEMLIYPDALSLKHANRYFYSFVDTGVELKVEWLVERRKLHLDCPSEGRCDLGTDSRFCRGSVALLMRRRREHVECQSRPGLGCVVLGTPTCPHRAQGWRPLARFWRRVLQAKLTIEVKWLVLAMMILLWSWSSVSGRSQAA